MQITVRKAERSDIETLQRLICALADFENLAPPDAEAQQRFLQHGWPEDGKTPCFTAWLAEIRTDESEPAQAAAYAITFLTYSSFLAKPTLYLEDIFVLPEYRRFGVGGATMKRLREEAEALDCGRMEWVVLDWNTNAQEFYQRLGAKHLEEWYHYRLDIP